MHYAHTAATEENTRQINSRYAWFMCLLASLFFFYEFIQMNVFNGISESVQQAFHLNAKQLGFLVSMYFYGNFAMVVPAGMLLDRFSTKKLILISMLLCTVATFAFAYTSNVYIAGFARAAEGIGGGFCFLSCVRLASRWFTVNHLAFVTGVVVTMAMIGGMLSQTPMAMLSEYIGWRQAMVVNGGLGVAIIALIYFFLKDWPVEEKEEAEIEERHLHKLGVWRSFVYVIKNPNNWFGGLYTTLMNLPIFILGALWGVIYLQQVHGLSHSEASYVTSMLFVGVIFGSPAFGWFSDKIESRRLPMVIGAITSLFTVLAIMFIAPLPLYILLILFFLLGFLTSSQIISYPAIAELNPIELTGSATSVVSLTIMSSGFIVQPLFGWFIELHWHHTAVLGHPVYTHQDFLYGMAIMPICFIVGLLVCFLIKETGCRSQYEHLPD